jgi:TolB-like protein/Tfp pilus assembly protein PilF
MMIPASSPGMNAEDGAAGSEEPMSDAPDLPPAASPAAPMMAPTLAYADFAAAVKDALRDVHSPDLLSRNPLLLHDICNLGVSAGPQELKALLCETVGTLFGNAHDEKLRRVLELTYSETALKQEVVADRLSLSFGTYRRHLTAARDRLVRWLWESSRVAQAQPELPSTPGSSTKKGKPEGETAITPETREPTPPRLSLVVLPFVNIGGSAEDEPFVDGITETLTTDLSRCSGVSVISRSTAFAYKGKPIDTRQIGRELGVRYLLEGSVQNAGERMRFNAQLVDTESGAHVCAERFDKERAGLLDMQDEVTTRLTRTIHVELIAAESRRAAREHPDRLDSIDHTLRGWATWHQQPSLETAQKARRLFEAALRLDESNIVALLGLANAHMWEVNIYASGDRAGQIGAAEAAAAKALALAPGNAEAHVACGRVLLARRAPERALREFQLAIGLDGNLAVAHAYLGHIELFLGRAAETEGHVREAMRLSPRDPLLFLWHYFIGVADLYLGRVAHGIESLRKSVEINPNWGFSRFVLAGALALAGLFPEANEVCATARRLAPNFTIAKFRAEAVSDNPAYLAQSEHFCEGLRLAGAPEGWERQARRVRQ